MPLRLENKKAPKDYTSLWALCNSDTVSAIANAVTNVMSIHRMLADYKGIFDVGDF